MASGNPVLGKTVQPDLPWSADKSSVRVQSGWVRFWAGCLARSRDWGRRKVPVGYEDETGFHFGTRDGREIRNEVRAKVRANADRAAS
jgi:hypothetical protein